MGCSAGKVIAIVPWTGLENAAIANALLNVYNFGLPFTHYGKIKLTVHKDKLDGYEHG